MKNFLIFFIAFYSINLPIMADVKMVPIIPQPQIAEIEENTFSINSNTSLNIDPLFDLQKPFLDQVLKETLNLTLNSNNNTRNNRIELKKLDLSGLKSDSLDQTVLSKIKEEGYTLTINEKGISLAAVNQQGMFYAIQSLKMLFRANGNNQNHLSIIDWPDLKMRGITDDMSRGQVSTMENFKKIIRFLAEHKMNVYMPYIEDIFFFKAYPSIGKNRGALTAEEFLELQDYAEKRYVEIIPIFQTLGHYENILLMPEFRDLGEFPGAASLNILSEKADQFLEKTLAEIIPLVKSEYFHIGADESWDVGKHATKELADEIGIASLHAQHYRKVFNMVKKYNKKVMMYGDIVLHHPTILNEIPKDLIMFDWHYYPTYNYESTETFSKANQPFIVSAGVHNWRNFFPRINNAIINIEYLTKDGYERGAMGSITSNWGDYGGMNLREYNYLPNAWSANISWNPEATDYSVFQELFFKSFFDEKKTENYKIAYSLLDDMANRVEWLTMVGHPFYPLSDNPTQEMQAGVDLVNNARLVKEQLKNVNPQKNKEHIDLMLLAADFYEWYGQVLNFRIEMTDSKSKKDKDYSILQKETINLAFKLNNLNRRYAAAWKSTNRPDNLNRMTDLWDRVEKYLLIKADEIEQGNLSFNGKLNTAFITHSKATDKNPLHVLYLRKQIQIDDKPDKAIIQLISNTHGKIWINGKEIGEMIARKSLSGWVESERVKTWDITASLKRGNNLIAIEVKNYTANKAAANVWLQFQINNKWQKEIISDEYWKAADRYFENWNTSNFNDSAWPNAIDAGINWMISKPYLEHNLPSRIEFFSGYNIN